MAVLIVVVVTALVVMILMVVVAVEGFRALWMAQVSVWIMVGVSVDVRPVPVLDDDFAHSLVTLAI